MKKFNLRKKFLFFFIILILLIISCGEKIAYINNQEIINNYPATAQAQDKIISYLQPIQKRLQELENDIDKLQSGYNTVVSNLSTSQKENFLKKIQKKKYEYDKLQKEIDIRLEKLNNRYMTPIYSTINTLLDEYGKQHNYDFILGTAQSGSIIYAKENKNITDDVIRFMKERYNKLK